MPHPELLNRLAELAGIVPAFWRFTGEFVDVPEKTKSKLLAGLGFDVSSDAEMANGIRRLEERPWRNCLDPVSITRLGRDNPAVTLRLPRRLSAETLEWRIKLESAESLGANFTPGKLKVLETRDINGDTLHRYELALPDQLPLGYHRFEIADDTNVIAETTVIAAPLTSFLPEWMVDGQRKWGIAGFLPSLRSGQNWGIGDFGDLADLAATASDLGASAIGLNPQHALFTGLPEEASPYCPSSRTFLNVLNIDLTVIDEFAECGEVRELIEGDAFSARLEAARSSELIDYTAVCKLKTKALRLLFKRFETLHPARPNPSSRRAAFEAFRRAGGTSLHRFAQFEALHAHFGVRAWTDWPAPFRRPDSTEVVEFANSHARDVDFHAFAQWQADRQFSAAAERCETLGLEIGLNRDLAVGCHLKGADSWTDPNLYVSAVRFGAPPDLFNSAGQNWGMAPINPLHLRDNAYAPFIEMLRANMRYAGALRIDHVMALEQLYWIPDGEENSAGAYVRYPFDDLLAIVALESHRNRCFVIGEDLGTVPSNFRERMAAENILSYRVSQFERHPDGLYFRPSVYPDLALATATTHDLPTIRGHWQETDIHIRHELAANASPEDLKAQLAERAHDRDLLRAALVDQGLVDKKFPLTADLQDGDLEILIAAVERFVARTPSRLLLANLTDLLAEDDLLNLPGTIDEYPNWRRKLRLATNDLSADPTVRAAADAILAERP